MTRPRDLCQCGRRKNASALICQGCQRDPEGTKKKPMRPCALCGKPMSRKLQYPNCWNCDHLNVNHRTGKVEQPKKEIDIILEPMRASLVKVRKAIPSRWEGGLHYKPRIETYYRCPTCGGKCLRRRCVACELPVVTEFENRGKKNV
jgi:hypothetical protein